MLIDRLDFSLKVRTVEKVSFRTGAVAKSGEKETGAQLVAKTVNAKNEIIALIHATAIKGALRSALKYTDNADDLDIEDVFGTTKAQEKSVGKMGRLVMGPALGCEPLSSGNKTVPTRTRNAINRKRGTAEHNKLYEAEYLPAGTLLQLTGQLFYNRETERKQAHARLAKLLLPMFRDFPNQGLVIGSGGKSKNSLFGDVDSVTCKQVEFATSGDWQEEDCSALIGVALQKLIGEQQRERPADLWTLELTSKTPFIIMKSDGNNGDDAPQIQAERDSAGNPILYDTSLIGVLRSRMEWLENLNALQKKTEISEPFEKRFESGSVRKRSEIESLTPVEILFGVSGYAGRMEVVKLERTTYGQENTLVNIAVDRFTGGALNSALFNTQTHMGAAWKITFAIPRSEKRSQFDDSASHGKAVQRACLERLTDDLQQNGLMIGHGSAKGLGWFDVGEVNMNWVEKNNG